MNSSKPTIFICTLSEQPQNVLFSPDALPAYGIFRFGIDYIPFFTAKRLCTTIAAKN